MRLSIASLLIFGILFTFWDYRNWQHTETDKLGQGRNNSDQGMAPAKLENTYNNSFTRLRFKYPSAWHISDNPEFLPSPTKTMANLLQDGQRKKLLQIDYPAINIEVQHLDMHSSDWINYEAENHVLTEDRAIISSDKAELVILTWEEGLFVVQEAIGHKEDRIYILKTTAQKSTWDNLKNTLGEVYKTVILL